MLNLLKKRQVTHDGVMWRCHTMVEKYEGDPTQEERELGLVQPFEIVEREGNLLVIGGASVQWQTLIGNGTGTAVCGACWNTIGGKRSFV